MVQFFLAIALVTFSIFIHELGHFLVARWRKLVVPRFSIFGLGKPIVSKRWRGVEYCICWLPFGAYVMIPQLSDLGDFEGELPPETQSLPPADYLSKVLVAIAGPFANLAFVLLLACVVWIAGVREPAEFSSTAIGEVANEIENSTGKMVPGPAAAAGLQPGDIIRQVDGNPVANFQDVIMGVFFGAQIAPDGRRVATLTFQRGETTMTRQVYPELTGRESLRTIGIGPHTDLVVEKIAPDSPAAKAGLLPGDRFISIDGKPLSRREELRQHFQKKNAEPSSLVFKRADVTMTTALQPRLQTIEEQKLYLVGITWKFETVLVHRTPIKQIEESCRQIYQTFASLLNRSSDIGVRHMSGIVGIVDNLQQAASAGIIPMLAFLLAINLSLAIFNLLPIPVLDGGHILIATLTKLRGRPPNPLWLQKAVAACFLMLMGLIAYVSYHDIRRVVQNHMDDNSSSAVPVKADAKDPKAPANPAPANEK